MRARRSRRAGHVLERSLIPSRRGSSSLGFLQLFSLVAHFAMVAPAQLAAEFPEFNVAMAPGLVPMNPVLPGDPAAVPALPFCLGYHSRVFGQRRRGCRDIFTHHHGRI